MTQLIENIDCLYRSIHLPSWRVAATTHRDLGRITSSYLIGIDREKQVTYLRLRQQERRKNVSSFSLTTIPNTVYLNNIILTNPSIRTKACRICLDTRTGLQNRLLAEKSVYITSPPPSLPPLTSCGILFLSSRTGT